MTRPTVGTPRVLPVSPHIWGFPSQTLRGSAEHLLAWHCLPLLAETKPHGPLWSPPGQLLHLGQPSGHKGFDSTPGALTSLLSVLI